MLDELKKEAQENITVVKSKRRSNPLSRLIDRFPHLNKRLIILVLIILAIPLTIDLALVQQDLRSRAAGPEIASVAVSPGSINSRVGDKSQPMSALVYDSSPTLPPPPAPHKLAKLFILKNITVCNTSSACLNLVLNDQQVDKLKNEFDGYKESVNSWLNGKMIVDTQVVVIDGPQNINMSSIGDNAWWVSPTDARNIIKQYVTKDTDFVFLTHATYDTSRQRAVGFKYCDLTSPADSGAIGTGYSWLPQTNPPQWYDCAEKKTMIHGFLHQIDWDLDHLNRIGDIYNNSYTKEMCGNTNPADNNKWFPDPDQADKVPDFAACVDHYNDWQGYCSSIRPEDCDYKFDQHSLGNHFPSSIDFIGNHCRDGIENYGELGIDTGYSCDTSLPTPTLTPTPTPVPTFTLNLFPSADSFVRSSNPTTNFGTQNTLETDTNPNEISYIKFNLSSLAGKKIVKATLTLKVSDVSSNAQTLKRGKDTVWSETTLTYNNKPGFEATITIFNAKPVNSLIQLGLTNAVNLRKGGNLSVGITSAGNDKAVFYSRESAASNRPQLIIQYQ